MSALPEGGETMPGLSRDGRDHLSLDERACRSAKSSTKLAEQGARRILGSRWAKLETISKVPSKQRGQTEPREGTWRSF